MRHYEGSQDLANASMVFQTPDFSEDEFLKEARLTSYTDSSCVTEQPITETVSVYFVDENGSKMESVSASLSTEANVRFVYDEKPKLGADWKVQVDCTNNNTTGYVRVIVDTERG